MNKYYWLQENNGIVTVGLTEAAKKEIGNITFISLPAVGKKLADGDNFMNVEADKAVSDMPTPVVGEVIETNAALADDVSKLNSDDKSISWIVKIKK